MAKQGYLGNTNLKPAGTRSNMTPEQVKEFAKCAEDPIYFIKKYVKIINVDEGLVPFELYPFQEKMVNIFANNRFVLSLIPRQSGKCVYYDTKIKVRNKKTGEECEMFIGDLYGLLLRTPGKPSYFQKIKEIGLRVIGRGRRDL